MLHARPAPSGTRWDALIGGMVEHVAWLNGWENPAWNEAPEWFLAPTWFVTDSPAIRVDAACTAPARSSVTVRYPIRSSSTPAAGSGSTGWDDEPDPRPGERDEVQRRWRGGCLFENSDSDSEFSRFLGVARDDRDRAGTRKLDYIFAPVTVQTADWGFVRVRSPTWLGLPTDERHHPTSRRKRHAGATSMRPASTGIVSSSPRVTMVPSRSPRVAIA